MPTFSANIFLKLIILLNGYEFVQAVIHAVHNDYKRFASPATNNINNSERLFHNKTSSDPVQENLLNYQQGATINYNMLKHGGQFEPTILHQLPPPDQLQTPLVKQFLRRKPAWPRSSACNMFDPQCQVGNISDKPIKSSDDHLKKRHLTDYNQPSAPTILEMPPNLHHHLLPLIVYKSTAKTMSHATSSEPSPSVTTEAIKALASTKTFNDEKAIFNNKFNYYDSNALIDGRSSSKQFLYSPLRSAREKELTEATNILPYPPSFIYITTTVKPTVLHYNTVEDNKMPDFFTHRQFKSLWDSYIPSWQTMKFMQKFRINSNTNNNLQTLAFTKDGKKKIEK